MRPKVQLEGPRCKSLKDLEPDSIFLNLLSKAVLTILAASAYMIIVGLGLVLYTDPRGQKLANRKRVTEFLLHNVKMMLLLGGALLGLSPVLMTLTSSYSSDTIWFLTFSLYSIHIVFHDYTKKDPADASK